MKFKNLIYITFLLAVGLMSAQQTIQGSVSDDTGPLPGVSVLEKGTSNGVVSDFDGNFLITVANSDATLVFSYVGFETQEVSMIQGLLMLYITLSSSRRSFFVIASALMTNQSFLCLNWVDTFFYLLQD